MKTKYSIGFIDLRHELDHKTPEKVQLFQEYRKDFDKARLFLMTTTRGEIELIFGGNKLMEAKVT